MRVGVTPVNTHVDRAVLWAGLVVADAVLVQRPVLDVVVLVAAFTTLVLQQPGARRVALEGRHQVDVWLPTSRLECLATTDALERTIYKRLLTVVITHAQLAFDNTVAIAL